MPIAEEPYRDFNDSELRWLAALRNQPTATCGHTDGTRLCIREIGHTGKHFYERVNLTHGASHSPIYYSWTDMKRRCLDPRQKAYPRYGGRGITVCERWLKFENFAADMGPMPKGLTLERIDTNGNYEPENCKWATHDEQQNNRRDNIIVDVNGNRMTVARAARSAGLRPRTLAQRLRNGEPLERALRPSSRTV